MTCFILTRATTNHNIINGLDLNICKVNCQGAGIHLHNGHRHNKLTTDTELEYPNDYYIHMNMNT